MSGPAVAGLVANLLYVNDGLTFSEIQTILRDSSNSISLTSCPNDSDEGNCNGIKMTCDDIIDEADSYSSNSYSGYVAYAYGYWECSDGCSIRDDWVNDDYCDCRDCSDEYNTEWNCGNCDCPDSCGEFTYCPGYPDGTSTFGVNGELSDSDDSEEITYFDCNDGCNIIPLDYVNDGSWCDCFDCSDEEEWTCDSCVGGCPIGCNENNENTTYTYCWQQTSSNYISDIDSHKQNEYLIGSGSHCGCPGANEEFDTVTLNNLNNAIHGASSVYNFNGDWILINGCINSASYYLKSIENLIFGNYENFVLYFNGGQWIIAKESNINGYWAGCPHIDLFDCNGEFWIHGNNGSDEDSSITTQWNNQCTTSIAQNEDLSLSVLLSGESSESFDDDNDISSNGNNNNDKISQWAWLLIGASIMIAIIGIGAIYLCGFKKYKIVNANNPVEYNTNSYNLMKD